MTVRIFSIYWNYTGIIHFVLLDILNIFIYLYKESYAILLLNIGFGGSVLNN